MNFDLIAEQSRASIEKEDLKVLLPLVAKIEPKNILEIGTWKGYSMEVWEAALDPEHFITIEKDKKPEDAVEISWKKYGQEQYIYLWETDSHSPKAEFNHVKWDFLFIDGDHSLEGVKKDFEMYSPLVRKGGIIAFHDACYHADKTEEVDIFWNEIKTQYPYIEIKVGKSSTGIGVIFV